VSDFLTTADGLALAKAFMRIKNPAIRRRIVELVKYIARDDSPPKLPPGFTVTLGDKGD
jgi:hypothetical protein